MLKMVAGKGRQFVLYVNVKEVAAVREQAPG